MRTRFPQCNACGSPIDPMNDPFKITNPDEAKYGIRPEYEHEVCPALLAEDESVEGLELEEGVGHHQFDVADERDDGFAIKDR